MIAVLSRSDSCMCGRFFGKKGKDRSPFLSPGRTSALSPGKKGCAERKAGFPGGRQPSRPCPASLYCGEAGRGESCAAARARGAISRTFGRRMAGESAAQPARARKAEPACRPPLRASGNGGSATADSRRTHTPPACAGAEPPEPRRSRRTASQCLSSELQNYFVEMCSIMFAFVQGNPIPLRQS